jgi:hypothetical protein
MMANFLYSGLHSGLAMDANTKGSGDSLDIFQYVNPQDTDIQYRLPRDDPPSTVSNGLMTPPQTIIDPLSRRPSLLLSNTAAPYNAGPGSASSASSFDSSPGFSASCPSSASTAPSSRRQSVFCPDNQQQHYLSATSPSPFFRSGMPKETWNFDQELLQPHLSINDQSIRSDAASFVFAGDAVTSERDNDPLAADNPQMVWQDQNSFSYRTPASDLANRTLTMDLFSNDNGSLPPRPIEYSQAAFESPQPSLFPDAIPQGLIPSQSSVTPNSSVLGPSWEHQSGGHDDDMSCSDDEFLPDTETMVRQPFRQMSITRVTTDDSKLRCLHCPSLDPPKRYACNRPEHMKRHCAAKHPRESGYLQEVFTCEFEDCIDKKTGKRKVIVARGDNFKAHYTKTHFSYGNTEKSGKNVRKSMKMSIEKGLRGYDARWTLMLAGKMRVGEDLKTMGDDKPGQSFLSVWKMIGYSIKETQEIKVKDIVPDWQGPDNTTLEKFDCRWKALKSKSLEYEQAMSVGTNMLETPKQGLLGVDMMESKEMGLVGFDPRWIELRSGRMTIEDSEKLGVKQLALQARCKR